MLHKFCPPPITSPVFRLLTLLTIWSVVVLPAASQEQIRPSTPKQESKTDRKDQELSRAQKIMETLESRIKKQQEELELLKLFASSLNEIERSYVQKVDRRRLIEAAIEGMLSELDPYSDYIPPAELEAFESEIESEYGGIGIRVTQLPTEEFLTVATPILDSPSFRAGVRANWWITWINGVDASGFTVQQATDAIQGKIGTKVRMRFRAKKTGEEKSLEIERALVQIPTVLGDLRLPSQKWDFVLQQMVQPGERIGYLRITNFGRQTGKELREVISDLTAQKIQGLIVDLRFNPGGLLASAVEVCDLFVDRGLIVRTEGRNAIPRKWNANQAGTFTGFPIAVIVNDRSASASEIVAACLKDSGRAVIVGERTFGKGSVQNIVKLEQGKSLMKLTTASYFRPNGQNIDRRNQSSQDDQWGVKPNPGLEVVFDDARKREYFEYRQDRDVVRQPLNTKKNASPKVIENNSQPTGKFDDLQLAKAVEAIRKAIASSPSVPQK